MTPTAAPLCLICLEYLLPVIRTSLCISLLQIIDLNGIEDLILALAGQCKQLSHEPEKFR